jgi:alpha-tubulin suppressor-like RCC1 family protein
MKRLLTISTVALAALGAGCSDSTTAPSGIAALLAGAKSSTAASTNGRVHFLPPVALKSPTAAGPFDATLSPVVEVCAWRGVWSDSACDTPVAVFTTQGSGAERVRVDGDDYIVNWDTGKTGTDYAANHRIRVMIDGAEAGHVDLTFASNGKNAGQLVSVAQGATLPIRFRIDAKQAAEQFDVDAEGGTFELFGGRVRLVIPAGAVVDLTTISVRESLPGERPDNPAPLPNAAFQFAPSGLVFAQSASLTIQFNPALLPAGVTTDDVTLYHVPLPESVPLPLEATARTANSVTANINGFSGYYPGFVFNPFPTTIYWRGGATGSPTAWSTAANWEPARVPTAAEFVWIDPAPNMPRLSANQSVLALRVTAGASLDLQSFQLAVLGSVDATGEVTGAGFVSIFDLSGFASVLGSLPELRILGGAVTLLSTTNIARNVLIGGPGAELRLASFTMNVGGEFRTEGANGRVVMDHDDAALNITGPLRFRAGGPSSLFSKGITTLYGGFEQRESPTTVQGLPAHRTVLAGGSDGHVMRMDHAGQSYLGELVLASSGGVTLLGDVAVNGGFSYDDPAIGAAVFGGGPAFSNGGYTLTIRDYAFFRGPVALKALRVGGELRQVSAYPYDVATTAFTGASPLTSLHFISDVKFKDVVIDGANLFVGAPFVQIGGNLAIVQGSLNFVTGTARTLAVMGDLSITGNTSHLNMKQADDRMVVHGNALFSGKTLPSGLSAGRLWLGGNVTQANGSGALIGSGTHTTILFGSGEQNITFPQAQNENWFGRLAITNSGEGVKFLTNAEVRTRLDLVGKTVLNSGKVVVTDTVIYRSTSHSSGTGGARISCKSAYSESGATIINVGDATGGCQPGGSSVPAKGDYNLPSSITVQISAPSTNASFTVGQSVTFTGSATDIDGAPLTGSSLSWNSSKSGHLGTGNSVTTSSLATGVHLIRLAATGATTIGVAEILVVITDVPLPTTISLNSITARGSQSCGLTTGGIVYCWGVNTVQVSESELGNSNTPALQPGGMIFASMDGQCAITGAGAAYCRIPGQLTLAPVAGGHVFASITSGGFHSCALTPAGAAYCWGSGEWGQLGNGEVLVDYAAPVAVQGGHTFTRIAAGTQHTCGVTSAGKLMCWGRNNQGQVGDESGLYRTVPTGVVVDQALSFASVSTRGDHTCALTTAGSAWCWGNNASMQLGDGTTQVRYSPVPVNTALTFASIGAGAVHSCARTVNGEIHCWGSNAQGRLGDGTTTARTTVVKVNTALQLTSLAVGGTHSCAMTAEKVAYCWGRGFEGQLGGGDYLNSLTPAPVAGQTALVTAAFYQSQESRSAVAPWRRQQSESWVARAFGQ